MMASLANIVNIFVLGIFVWYFVWYLWSVVMVITFNYSEKCSEPCQISKMKYFTKKKSAANSHSLLSQILRLRYWIGF